MFEWGCAGVRLARTGVAGHVRRAASRVASRAVLFAVPALRTTFRSNLQRSHIERGEKFTICIVVSLKATLSHGLIWTHLSRA